MNATFYTTLVLLTVIASQAVGAWLELVLRKGWRLLSPVAEAVTFAHSDDALADAA